jgi:hypothetical protein
MCAVAIQESDWLRIAIELTSFELRVDRKVEWFGFWVWGDSTGTQDRAGRKLRLGTVGVVARNDKGRR